MVVIQITPSRKIVIQITPSRKVVIQITPSRKVVIQITTIFNDCFRYFDRNAFILRINILVQQIQLVSVQNYASNCRDLNHAITKRRDLNHDYV